MKNAWYLLLIATLISLSACSWWEEDKPKANYLPPLQIEIPPILAEKKDVVDYIKRVEVSINKWTIKSEDLIVELKPFLEKKGTELSVEEQMRLAAIGARAFSNSMQAMGVLAKYEAQAKKLKKEMTTEEKEAFRVIQQSFFARMNELKKKYKKYEKQMKNFENLEGTPV